MTEGQAEESGAEKTTGKKTTTSASKSARKTPAKKAGAKKTTSRSTKAASGNGQPRRASARAEAPPSRMTGSRVAGEAARQLLELTGRETEGVVGLERTDDGWTVLIEVLELRRIPNTTDVLAIYEVTVDGDGELEGYRRLQRYVRGTPGDD
jgi:hypothetical protein